LKGRYTRAVPRIVLALAVSSLVLAWPLSSGASVDGTGTPGTKRVTAVTGQIALKARYRLGTWTTKLSLKLVKTKLTSFEVCAIWNRPATAKWGRRCRAAVTNKLPEGTVMRLEQNPVRRALVRDDSPGWGMLGLSSEASLGAVLSNELSDDRFGTMYYRVTLRDHSGQVLVTSNRVPVVWHR